MQNNLNTNSSATNPERKKFVESAASKSYKGPSVVDYLSMSGYDASPSSRQQLATDYNVSGYDFSGAKNTELMGKLRGGAPGQGGVDVGTQSGTTTQPPTTPRTVDPDFQAYLDSLNETSEEKGAREYVSRLLSDSRAAHEKALQSGETMGFAQGEAARVKRNNDLTIDSASSAYDVIKSGRERQSSIAKLRYDYSKSIKDKEAEMNKPFELSEGQSRYVYNPTTKEYEAIAVKPKTYKPTTTPSVPKPTQTQQRNSDVNAVVDALEKAMKAKNQFGIDPTNYDYYTSEILREYGSTGVNELKKQLAAKGLKVDRKQDPKNYK